MKTIERLLLLIAFLAAIGACLNACGEGAPPTCVKPVDSACEFKNTDGQFYRFERNAWGFPAAIQCQCAEWSQQ